MVEVNGCHIYIGDFVEYIHPKCGSQNGKVMRFFEKVTLFYQLSHACITQCHPINSIESRWDHRSVLSSTIDDIVFNPSVIQ